jgi:hypothetical protein
MDPTLQNTGEEAARERLDVPSQASIGTPCCHQEASEREFHISN